MYKKNKDINEAWKQEQIKDMIHTMQRTPKQGISQNQHTYEPANTSTWQKIKQVHGITEVTHSLPTLIYTNLGPSYHSAWTRGPLATYPKEAAIVWIAYRRALASNYRDPTHSHINEYLAHQTSTLEEERDQTTEERDQTSRADQEQKPHQPTASDPLNLPITPQEVLSAIKRLQKGKSPGPDSITNNLIKGGEEVMSLLLHTLYTAVCQWSTTPAQWRKALVKPIYKGKKKEILDPSIYRGIALSSALAKSFESVVDRRLDTFTKMNDTCTLAQYGSKTDHATIDAPYPLVSHIQKRKLKGKIVYCAMLHFETAFPSVS